jgi:predicted Rossmann fold nucleotide-binding protein DprA/Smf involved in DNA uptake
MTTREFLNSVISANISDDMNSKAQDLISALDAKNEKRKSSDSKSKREATARRDAVHAYLSKTPVYAEPIAEALGLSVGQVRSALSALVRDGLAIKAEVKDGKSRKMAYSVKE